MMLFIRMDVYIFSEAYFYWKIFAVLFFRVSGKPYDEFFHFRQAGKSVLQENE